MKHELIFSGIGGQGVLLVGQMLCSAAVSKGHQVTWVPFYGQEKEAVEPCAKLSFPMKWGPQLFPQRK